MPKWARALAEEETVFAAALFVEAVSAAIAAFDVHTIATTLFCTVCVMRMVYLNPLDDEVARQRAVSTNEKLWIAYGLASLLTYLVLIFVHGMTLYIVVALLFLLARSCLAFAGLKATNSFYVAKPPRVTRGRPKTNRG